MTEGDPKTIVETQLGREAAQLFEILLNQKPQKADAVVLVQGDRFDRASKAYELYSKGFAKALLITGNNDLIGRGKRNEENDVHLSELQQHLVEHGIPKETIMIDDQSLNTLDQAVHTVKQAKEKSWEKLLIVTSPYHVLRTYLTFLKQAIKQQWTGRLIMQAADLRWDGIPSGREKTAEDMLVVEMEKIKQYTNDLASIEEGRRFLQQNL